PHAPAHHAGAAEPRRSGQSRSRPARPLPGKVGKKMSKVSHLGQAKRALDTPEDIVADLKAGKMVVIMDDEDRENEGDLVMAASLVRPEDINFMARYGRGLICLTLTAERCRQLRLPPMVSHGDDKHR